MLAAFFPRDFFRSRPLFALTTIQELYSYELKPTIEFKTPDYYSKTLNNIKVNYLICVVSYSNILSKIIGIRCNYYRKFV